MNKCMNDRGGCGGNRPCTALELCKAEFKNRNVGWLREMFFRGDGWASL